MSKMILVVILFLISICAIAEQVSTVSISTSAPSVKEKQWYEKVHFKGYAQFRYNRAFESNDQLTCDQCDKSLGENNGFFLRRARMIFYGDLNDQVYFYIQPDLVSAPSNTTQNYSQIRDLYFDLFLDQNKTHRFRVGQSKVPFGFENLQSSSNRLALDRDDALNSAVANERDIGIFYYWASSEKKSILKKLTKNNLKGSGDYGVVGFGAYNGQTANKPEQNNNLHLVARLSNPIELSSGQIIEYSIQALRGKYVISTNQNIEDNREAISFVYYPQPFGFQFEYTEGEGPEYDKNTSSIKLKDLKGGYAQLMYSIKKGTNNFIPYVRYQTYEGGKKHETGAPSHSIVETEAGVEWLSESGFELTAAYSYGEREVTSSTSTSDENGSRIRLQLQVNY